MDGGPLLETFRSPPARYGPAPLLVFNDEHEGVAGEARITEALEGHERIGLGEDLGPVSDGASFYELCYRPCDLLAACCAPVLSPACRSSGRA